MRTFECPYCRECSTDEEWNDYNKLAFSILGMSPLPNAYEEEDEACSLDCPKCEERVVVTDLEEF